MIQLYPYLNTSNIVLFDRDNILLFWDPYFPTENSMKDLYISHHVGLS